MSKEVEERKSCSNVVAKLMGLETAAPVSRSRSSSPCWLSSVDREFEDWEAHHKTRKGKCVGDKQMDLVRRKLMEAKRLVTDDKLHRSKEFQEALEVLSSNKDLFVQFLQESNSLFSLHLSEFQPAPPHPEATRITVLRPSKAVDTQKSVVQDSRSNQETGWFDAAQPTRIVVLKPSPGKAIASSETRQVAKDVTHRIRETFRNDTLSSSSSCVLSNDYIGDDDGSLNRSNNEYLVGNTEIMSPSSRHSWDCVNRFESPFSSSSSSFSRVESSSVYREAKKRLSERWAIMSLNGDTQQQLKHLPKASTALGDMLALSKTKVATRSNQESNKAKQETRRSVSCIGSGLGQAENTSDPLTTLERSKSVPEIRVHGGTSVSKPQTESRSVKPSWKVPSLFFFKNRKANKDKIDDQPSPVSVLEPPFQDPECCGSTKPWTTQGEEMSLKSNLIDKSPPIGSVARVFSWEDESYTDLAKPGTGLTEDEDWYYLIKTLLTASGFSGSDPLMTQWHSPDRPLDPSSLRDNFANKRREQRSNHKLMFDCVNAIITETTSRAAAHTGLTEGFDMVEHVWSEFKECVAQDSKNSLKEEIMVREEVVGEMWSHNLQVQVNILGTEIEVMLLQELVQEAVFSLGSYSLTQQRTYAFI